MRTLGSIFDMVEWLVLMIVFCLVCVGACAGVLYGLLHLLSVRNRVVLGRRSPAPLAWIVSPDGAARLHRRLQRAMAMAPAALHGRQSDDLGLGGIIVELQDRAFELDSQLVIASQAPRAARRRMLRELHSEIAEVELLVQRTVRMGRAWIGSAPSERGLAAVRERLELLETSLRELDGVDVLRQPAPDRIERFRA